MEGFRVSGFEVEGLGFGVEALGLRVQPWLSHLR